ncbi:MAG: ATP-binding protein [Clostridiales bacterium]|nr:ATP-binding protein [Clostridiales bacterium]MCF8022064.1 ATP-binding protein [Clostridiales bacterium]
MLIETPGSYLDTIINILPVGLLFIDRDGRVRLFNRLFSDLSGINEKETLGCYFGDLLKGVCLEQNKLLKTLYTCEEYCELKTRDVFPGLISNDYIVNTYPVLVEKNQLSGAVAVLLPAKKQIELENAVIKAEKLAILGQLAASTVHEIKNALATISGFLQLLQKDLQGTSREEHLHIMFDELKHVERLISEFLYLARPGYSRRDGCCVNKLIKDVLMLVESEASSRNVNIYIKEGQDISDIYADRDQLKQVLLNFIRNAFEAFSSTGDIIIETSWDEQDENVEIIIKDTGPGMDKKTIENIFDPFYTTKENSTGLGMFISKKIIENHGGTLKVESQLNKGTTLRVLLPQE